MEWIGDDVTKTDRCPCLPPNFRAVVSASLENGRVPATGRSGKVVMKADTDEVYSLADLGKTGFAGVPLAVIGHPIAHSLSPAMHNAALAVLREKDSRFAEWAYYRFDVPPEQLGEALPLFHKHSFLGLNLTVPHKVEAMRWIEGICPEASPTGAVNTLVWDEFGYDGFNTDGYGLSRGLREDLEVSLEGADVILLGSGGAARGAAVRCLSEGCARLRVGNRTPERLEAVLEALRAVDGGDAVEGFAPSDPLADLAPGGVLINATSLGLKAGDGAPFDVAALPADWKVYDMIYNPAETVLLREARARGLAAANGLSMLVHQGARSLEIWSHTDVDPAPMRAAADAALERKGGA